MGGHQSRQSVSMTADVLASAVQSVSQKCISRVAGGDEVSVAGSGNVVSGVAQSMSISVDSQCAAQVTQAASFQSSLAATVAQSLKDQQVAMTQWLDGSGDDSSTAIAQTVQTNVTADTAQTCLNDINSQNIVSVVGDGNVVSDVAQQDTVSLISRCMLGQGQTSKAVAAVTDTVNQHSTYTSKNPLAFIADAFEALARSALLGVAAVSCLASVKFSGITVRDPPAHRAPHQSCHCRLLAGGKKRGAVDGG